jgi:hypothetical protein
MAQIMPKEYSFGEDLGNKLGQGLQETIGAISNHKLNDMFQRYEQNRIAKAREEGNWGALPEEEQRELRQMYPKMYYGPETYAKMQDYGQTSLGQPEQQSPQIGQESMQGDQEQQAALSQGLERMLGQRPSMDMINQVLAGQTNPQAGSMMRNAYGSPQGAMQYPDLGTEMMQKLRAQPRRQQAIDPMEQEMPLEQSSQQQHARVGMPMTQAQRFRYELEQDKASRKASDRAHDLSQKEVERLEATNASIANRRSQYDEILNYARAGDLISGPPKAILDKLGLGDVFTTAPSQAVAKASMNTVLQKLGAVKGMTRGTNMGMDMLMRAGPNLLQNPLAMEAVIGSLKNADDYEEAINQKKIKELARYDRAGIVPPIDLDSRVRKQMQPYAKKKDTENLKLWDRINRESKATYQVVERGLDKPDDPTTYNTLKDQIYFDDPSRPGKYVGSDGKKQYEVVKRNGNLILVK